MPALRFPSQVGAWQGGATWVPLLSLSHTVGLFVFLFPYQLLTRGWGQSLKIFQMEILSQNRLSLIYETQKKKDPEKSPKAYILHTQWPDDCLLNNSFGGLD